MSDDDQDAPKVSRYEWERWVRRCVLPSNEKLVALTMATYAARDGSRIFPGVKRLSAVTSLSERTVRGALTHLREVGLIERVYVGGRRGTQSFTDVHRLVIPVDLLERIPALDPDEDTVPNRHDVPHGKAAGMVPNRQTTTSQPANPAPQPANDDIPTGTTCTPTTHRSIHRSEHPTTEGLPFGTRPTTGPDNDEPNNVIPIGRWAQ